MHSTARAMAVLGAGAAVVAGLTACGGSGGPKAAGTTASATGSTAPTTMAPAATTSPDQSYLAANGLRSTTLRANLLTPADFGSGFAYDSAPDNNDFPGQFPLDALASDLKCDDIAEGGSNQGARAWAETTVNAKSDHVKGFVIAGRQYDVDGGANLVRNMEQLARTTCAKTTDTTDGTDVVITTTTKPRSGVGTEADLFEQAISLKGSNAGPLLVIDTLVARYGDTVLTVGISGLPDQVKTYDLAAKVKVYAGKLGLH